MKWILFFLLLPVLGHAQHFHIYLTLVSDKKGVVGAATQKARSDGKTDEYLSVQGFKVDNQVPADAHVGGSKGQRQHKPILVTREVDEASPRLLSALHSNELFKTVVIRYIATDGPNKDKVFRMITLKNATITRVNLNPPVQSRNDEHSQSTSKMEDYAFQFQDIAIENPIASTSTADDVTANND